MSLDREPPAYRPDRNPIEQVFSEVTNELRRWEPRAVVGVAGAFGRSLDRITSTDARGHFRHAGYPPDCE